MLFHLGRSVPNEDGFWECAHGFVIRALSPSKARKIASEEAGNEGSEVWLNTQKSFCRPLDHEGEEGVVIKDYTNG